MQEIGPKDETTQSQVLSQITVGALGIDDGHICLTVSQHAEPLGGFTPGTNCQRVFILTQCFPEKPRHFLTEFVRPGSGMVRQQYGLGKSW